jgi:hypothetical protein
MGVMTRLPIIGLFTAHGAPPDHLRHALADVVAYVMGVGAAGVHRGDTAVHAIWRAYDDRGLNWQSQVTGQASAVAARCLWGEYSSPGIPWVDVDFSWPETPAHAVQRFRLAQHEHRTNVVLTAARAHGWVGSSPTHAEAFLIRTVPEWIIEATPGRRCGQYTYRTAAGNVAVTTDIDVFLDDIV